MSIQVTACLNPFSQERTEFSFEGGASVREIIKKIDTLHAVNTGWRVMFDDEIITDFERVPEEKNHVYIKLVPEGDNKSAGTGMKVGGGLAILGGVLAIGLLGWTGVGGVLGATLIGAGIGCVAGGAVLYNIDIPSVSTNKKKQESPEQDPSVRGSENQMRPYGVIPTLLGKRRIYADLAAKSYTWSEDGSVYLYQLFCAGQKDMTIDTSTIKIDETPVTAYSATGGMGKILSGNDTLIDMRIHQDGTMPVLYDKCVNEEQVNAILRHETEDGVDGSVIRTTPDGTEEINVDVFFLNGLGKYKDDGSLDETSVELGVWYKKAGEPDNAYRAIGGFSNEVRQYNHSQTFSLSVKASVGDLTSSQMWDYFSKWSYKDGEKFSVDDSNREKYSISITKHQLIGGFSGEHTETEDEHWYVFVVSYTETTPEAIFGSELRTKRYSVTKSGLDPASYTVKISRITADSTDSKVIDDVYVGSIRAAKHLNPVRSERAGQLTLIELKIKASEKLQNIVKKLNFVAQSKLPSYSGSGSGPAKWSHAESSNPASAAIYAMQSEVAQQKLSDSEIDWPAFERLHAWCQENGYECNAYVTESMPIRSLLTSIASTCRAEILRINGKITVIMDVERDSFTQLFTPRNSFGYSESIALSDIPDALALSFVDSSVGYAENMVKIYNTPTGEYEVEPDVTQDIPLWGVTDDKQARKIGMYNYAVTHNRFIIHKFSCDFEYLMCSKGDWIKYAGDIALAGISQGRISRVLLSDSGMVYGFECDEGLPMEAGKSYSMRVRKASGEAVLLNLRNGGSTTNTAILEDVIDPSSSPGEGALFAFGTRNNETIDLIITDIQCGENLSAELTCVEYSPEIFGVDREGFVLPEFENRLSETGGATDGPSPMSEWKTFFTYHDGEDMPVRPAGDGTNSGWHTALTAESKWMSSKTAKNIYLGNWGAPRRMIGEKGDAGDPGVDGSSLFVYMEQTHAVFSVDDLGQVEEAEVEIPIHVICDNLELPFRLGEIKQPDGMTVTEYEKNDGNGLYEHGIRLHTTRDFLLENGTVDIPIIYTEITHAYVYGDNMKRYAIGNGSGDGSAYGHFEFDDTSISDYNLVLTYSTERLEIYRGAMNTISGFLDPSNKVNLHRGDWFTWTGSETRATYSGVTVTFKPARVYKWNGDCWEEDGNMEHQMTALSDVLSTEKAAMEENNEKLAELLDRLTEQKAFLDRLNNDYLVTLMAKNETLQDNLAEQKNFLDDLNNGKLPKMFAVNEELDKALAEKDTFFETLNGNENFTDLLAANTVFTNKLVANDVYTKTLAAKEGYVKDLTTSELFADNLTANTTYTGKLVASEAFVDDLVANKTYTKKLVADETFTDKLVANTAYTEKLVADNTFTDKLVANKTYTSKLVSDTALIDHLVGNKAFFDQLFAQQLGVNGEIIIQDGKPYAKITSVDNATDSKNVANGTIKHMILDGDKDTDVAIRSADWKDASSTSGFGILKNGNAYFSNGVFRGKVYASDGEFTGTVNAKDGTFNGDLKSSTFMALRHNPSKYTLSFVAADYVYKAGLVLYRSQLTDGTYEVHGTWNGTNISSLSYNLDTSQVTKDVTMYNAIIDSSRSILSGNPTYIKFTKVYDYMDFTLNGLSERLRFESVENAKIEVLNHTYDLTGFTVGEDDPDNSGYKFVTLTYNGKTAKASFKKEDIDLYVSNPTLVPEKNTRFTGSTSLTFGKNDSLVRMNNLPSGKFPMMEDGTVYNDNGFLMGKGRESYSATNNYYCFPNGLKIHWGRTKKLGDHGTENITFSKPYINPPIVITTPEGGCWCASGVRKDSVTKNGCTVWQMGHKSGDDESGYVHWVAIGF